MIGLFPNPGFISIITVNWRGYILSDFTLICFAAGILPVLPTTQKDFRPPIVILEEGINSTKLGQSGGHIFRKFFVYTILGI